ncbi:MAG: YciI family protein [Burkholderiales bacterium]|nr:YciI family protein [Burkholderiales bacterium]
MFFAIHATDKQDALEQRAKFFREHRIHLDRAGTQGVSISMAGPLVADDGETPVGSLFVLEAKDRAAVDTFTRSDPYWVHGVWERIDIHYFNKKRG